MTYVEAVTALVGKHADAGLSPSATRGPAFVRAARLDFRKGKGGVYAGRDADGTEVLVYFNDTANVIACTAVEPDEGRQDEDTVEGR